MPRRGETNLTPAGLETALEAYRAGGNLEALAAGLHVAPRTLRNALTAAGVPLRTRTETCRLRALAQHNSPLWAVSAARWQELYWGKEKPSLAVLAARLGVCVQHLRAVLDHHGIHRRTAAEQLATDGRLGRRVGVGCPGPFTAADYARHADTFAAAHKQRSANPTWRRNMGLAHRKQETRLCQW